MNFRFQNLLGAPYRGGNVGDSVLLSPVGNRVSSTDLLHSQTLTLPFDASSNISRLAASPDSTFLLAVDDDGRASFVNYRRLLLPRRGPHRRWRRQAHPGLAVPGVQEGVLLVPPRDHTSFDWTPDSEFSLASSKDLSVRLSPVKRRKQSTKPFIFVGHREPVVGAFFSTEKTTGRVFRVYSISRDGAIFTWNLVDGDPPSPGTPEQRDFGKKRKDFEVGDGKESEIPLNRRKWELVKKDFFMQAPVRLTACDYHQDLDMVAAEFCNGGFSGCTRCRISCAYTCFRYRRRRSQLPFSINWVTG